MDDPTYNDYLKEYESTINEVCNYYCNRDNSNRIEFDDLYQEASLKLLEIYKDIEIGKVKLIKKIIKNHLVDYIRNWTKDSIYKAENIGLLNDNDI